MYSDVAVIIPSRLSSKRLPKKPLQLIGPVTLIEHVINSLKKLDMEHVYVATDSELIMGKAIAANCKYIIVKGDCDTGTDRVYNAFLKLPNANKINYIINVQGDMPFINPEIIIAVIDNLKNSSYDIMTPVTKVGIDVAQSHSNVKVIATPSGRALYFSRNMIPYGKQEFLYHFGIYGYRKEALSTFVRLPQSD